MIWLLLFGCIFVGAVALNFLLHFQNRMRKLPPGPMGMPIFGNLFQLLPNQFEAFSSLRKTYGDIFSVNLGSLRAVVLNDYKLVREAYVQSEVLERPFAPLAYETNGGIPAGIGFTNGNLWSEQRRFMLKNLKDFGFGSKSINDRLQNDALEIITELESKVGSPVDLRQEFNAAAVNSVWEIATGERFKKEDPNFNKILELSSKNLKDGKSFFTSLMFPWTKYLKLSQHKAFVKNISDMHDVLRKQIIEHKNSYNEDVQRDLIDCYLKQIKETTDPQSSFYKSVGEANMVHSLSDVVFTGFESIGVTLSWIALTLAHYPEKQEKLFEEIKTIIGLENQPSLADRSKMLYTQAVVNEVIRYTGFVPQNFRATHGTIELQGYIIPKGTTVLANHGEILKDPKVWGDPQNFRPERFINEDGSELIRHEAFMPFSIGKRSCPGETFAKDQLFIFTASLFQRFKVESDKNNPCTFESEQGVFTLYPKHHKLVLRKR